LLTNEFSGQVQGLFVPISLDTVHLAIHILLYAKQKLHPITALVLSFCFCGLWAIFGLFSYMANMCAEQRFPDTWETLFWIRQAVSYVLAMFYFAYFVYSCKATHRWRIRKKNGTGSQELATVARHEVERKRDLEASS
jgi:hypothetical protein